MKCPHCGQEHPDDFMYCPTSGQSLVPQTKKCDNCKYECIPVEAKFCPRCGKKFSTKQEKYLNEQRDISQNQIMIICSEDGATLDIGYGQMDGSSFLRERKIQLKKGENIISVKDFPEIQYGFSSADYRSDELKYIEDIILNDFDTFNIDDMNSMFSGFTSLKSLDLSSFNTSNVDDMNSMFQNCSSLRFLDLSGFDTSNVYDMSYMFLNCRSLRSLDLSSFNTSNVDDMNSMFQNCSSLRFLDLSGLDTSNVQDMNCMFNGCRYLRSLDLSGFDTSNVDDMDSMFDGCDSLKKIIMRGCNKNTIDDISEALEEADIDAKIITD